MTKFFQFDNKRTYFCPWTSLSLPTESEVDGKNHLYFTRGLPRSGKSTLSKEWAINYTRVVVCVDDFRLAVHGPVQYNQKAESIIAGCVWTTIQALLYKYDVILDDTNSSEWSLRQIFNIDPYAKYVNVQTKPNLCLVRMIQKYANENTDKECKFVIDRIQQQLETVDVEKIRDEYLPK